MDKTSLQSSLYPQQIIQPSKTLLARIKMEQTSFDRSSVFGKQTLPQSGEARTKTFFDSTGPRRNVLSREEGAEMPEIPPWRTVEFYLHEDSVKIEDNITIRYEYDGPKETHFIYVMKINPDFPPTFMDFTLFEAREVVEILRQLTLEIENCSPCDMIPTLKKSKNGAITDMRNPKFWDDDVTKTVSTQRIKIRPTMARGTYKIRILIPAPLSSQHKYGWLGRCIQIPARVAKQLLVVLEDLMVKHGNFKKPVIKRTQYDE